MKVHRYNVVMGGGERPLGTQNRLYIPGKCVIGYNKDDVVFFSECDTYLDYSEKVIAEGQEGAKYLGESDVTDQVIEDMVISGRVANEIAKKFHDKVRSLVGMLGNN